jgi:hypothetical protein
LSRDFESTSGKGIDSFYSVLSLFRIPEFKKNFQWLGLPKKNFLNSTTRGRNNFFKVFLKILKGFKIFQIGRKNFKVF